MKRVFPAVLLAVLIHVGFFSAKPDWFFDQSAQPPKSTAITVAMSYRQPPKPKVQKVVKKRPKIKKPEKPKTPQKPKPTPPPPDEGVLVPEEPEYIPPEEEIPEPVEDEAVEEDVLASKTHGESISNMNIVRDAVPFYKNNPPPDYPRAAKRRGYQGKVMLSVYVNVDGGVDNLWVFESSGYRLLDNAALKAVKEWFFEPGRKGDKKIAMWVNIPVVFELK